MKRKRGGGKLSLREKKGCSSSESGKRREGSFGGGEKGALRRPLRGGEKREYGQEKRGRKKEGEVPFKKTPSLRRGERGATAW